MIKKTITLTTITFVLTACSGSNDFSPEPNMTGKEIFDQSCAECHAPVGEYVMELSSDMKDADRIANKVLSGSLMMPSFPNIQGVSAKILSEYVVEHSKVKQD